MSGEPTTLRPAEATREDGLGFARYLNQAADGAFRVLLGRHHDQVLAEAFLQPGHDLSHERVVFAEQSDRLVGMASGYTAEQHAAASDRPLRDAAGWRMLRMAALGLLGRGMKRFIETVPDGDFYLMAVAVDDEMRGHGVGSQLLDHFEDRARAAGCRRFVLDVTEKNVAARRLYERRGMEEEAVSPSLPFAPGARASRMVKSL